MVRLRPNTHRAKTAIGLIWTVVALEAANGISSYLYYRELAGIRDRGPGQYVMSRTIELSEAFLGLAYLVVLIISAVTFIQWFRRACYNLNQIVRNMTDAETWAAPISRLVGRSVRP